jgi:hypothetical protein
MVYDTKNYRVYGFCPSSGILETRGHTVLETGCASALRRWEGDIYSVGSLTKRELQSLDQRW